MEGIGRKEGENECEREERKEVYKEFNTNQITHILLTISIPLRVHRDEHNVMFSHSIRVYRLRSL